MNLQRELESIHQACRVDGTLTFPAALGRLSEAGIESYHTDYRRRETTYYLTSGESHVVADSCRHASIEDRFDDDATGAAVRYAQSGAADYTYEKFVGLTSQAGCVGYIVSLVGRKALYFGRRGEFHEERFPTQE